MPLKSSSEKVHFFRCIFGLIGNTKLAERYECCEKLTPADQTVDGIVGRRWKHGDNKQVVQIKPLDEHPHERYRFGVFDERLKAFADNRLHRIIILFNILL